MLQTNNTGDNVPLHRRQGFGVAFHTHPGSQASSRGEAKDVLSRLIYASLVAQLVKNPPAMREIWVQSLDWDDPLEKGKATHSSVVAWRIPWGREELDMTE